MYKNLPLRHKTTTMALDKFFGLDRIGSLLDLNLPAFDNMDAYLNFIIPKVKSWGEDLREEKYYLSKRWKEIRDTDDFVENVLHFFNDGGEYLISVDGNISTGAWRYLETPNCLILEYGKVTEMFDLAFMNDDFFILQKHGDQIAKGHKQHFVMVLEKSVGGNSWRDSMDLLFNIYRGNVQFSVMLLAVIVVIGAVLAFSLF